ncbi:hypothetical protein CLU86_1094 [Acidovorax sp. 62]|nr:hypothetical protein CLU86_1094 [Acidovorax sp. 62]
MVGFDNLAPESDVPIRVPLFVCVYVKTIVHAHNIERQQVVSGSREKLNLIARFKYYLLRNHLKIQRQKAGRLVLEPANNRVIFWRHGESMVMADCSLLIEQLKWESWSSKVEPGGC